MRLAWLWSLAGSLIAGPLCAVLGVVVSYVVLAMAGVTEHEGRRGLMALAFGLFPGFCLGLGGGWVLVHWMLERARG